MNFELFAGLVLFATASSITPGPNNLMLMASGANFGFKRTLPHLLGVELGFTLLILSVGTGIGNLLEVYPASLAALRVMCTLYIGYLAMRLANTTSMAALTGSSAKPMTATEAVLFQWVNPKAWAMALTSVSLFVPSPSFSAVLFVAFVFVAIGVPCVSAWTLLGEQLQKKLGNEARLRRFNAVMSLMLIASVLPILKTGS
ncbi:MAG: LysE family translocator [Pseudomonadota bacterium]